MSEKEKHPEHVPVTFNRKEIYKKIEKLTYAEARRFKLPVYDALVMELNEENCTAAAKHFENLALKERKLSEMSTIGNQLKEDPALLYMIFENIKLAEQSFALTGKCGGFLMAFKLLHQTILLLEPHIKYDWLLTDVYKIIAKICENFQGKDIATNELISRIYYKYGVFLLAKGEELGVATKYLEKALHLCRGQIWIVETNPDWGVFETLHQKVCHVLFTAFMAHAEEVGRTNPQYAAQICQQAAWTIAEVSVEKNKLNYVRAKLAYADFKIEIDDFKTALMVLEKIQTDIKANCEEEVEFQMHSAKVYLSQGICYIGLEDHKAAYEHLRIALAISQKYAELKSTEGLIEMTLGKLYAKDRMNQRAKCSYEEAKRIFIFLGDVKNTMKITYLQAKLRGDEVFPYFMDLLKGSNEHFCCYYNIRQWKNRSKPFWETLCEDTQLQEKDEVYCLLKEGKDI